MKGTMTAKLIDIETEKTVTNIEVSNLKNKGDNQKFPLKGISNQKIALLAEPLQKKDSVKLKLSLEENLSVVSDFSASINGIDIDFSELDKQENEKQLKKQKAEEAFNKFIGKFLLGALIVFIIMFMLSKI